MNCVKIKVKNYYIAMSFSILSCYLSMMQKLDDI